MRLKDAVELSRPFTLLSPALGFLSGGTVALCVTPHPLVNLQSLWPLAVGVLSAALLNAASNVINQIFDAAIDGINKPTRPIPSGRVGMGMAWGLCVVLYGVSFSLAYAVPNKQFLYIVLATGVITYMYSGPPFRTKRFPYVANLTMAVPRGCLVIVAGWAAVRAIDNPEPWFIGGILGLFVFGAATTKDYSDIEGDRQHGCRTLPIVYGIKTSVLIISPFFVVPFLLLPHGIALGFLTGPPKALDVLSLVLALYGGFIIYLLLRKPEQLATESNHVSWKHMYLLLVASQVGVAICYAVSAYH